MAHIHRVIVITPETAQSAALASALRQSTEPGFDVLAAASAADAFREERFRDARLVIYDCVALPASARELLALYPGAALVACAPLGDEALVESELAAGATDYLLRDPSGSYLRLLPLKAARLAGSGDPSREPAAAGSAGSILRLEANLRRSEIRFGQLVQAIPDIVYHLDSNGNFVFVNSSISTLEYQAQDLLGKHFSVIVHPDDLPFVSRDHVLRRYREHALEPGTTPKLFDERRSGERRTRGLVVRLMTRPGSHSGASHKIGDVVSYGVIEAMGHYEDADTGDSFRGTVGIIHDVTLHRRSEEMMRVLLQAVDQSPVAIVLLDAGGSVEYVNPLFLRDSGLLPEQVIGRKVALLTESASVRSLFRILGETATRGSEWRGRLPDSGTSGGPPWRDLYVSPVRDPLGRTTHFVAVLTGDGSPPAR